MDITIREAVLNDYMAIADLNKNDLGYDFSPDSLKKRLGIVLKNTGHKIYVAHNKLSVIGSIHLNDYDCVFSEHVKNIIDIAVAKEYRRNGVGTLLLERAEKWAKNTGAVGIRLDSGTEMVDAHEFYKTFGYSEIKQHKNFIRMF